MPKGRYTRFIFKGKEFNTLSEWKKDYPRYIRLYETWKGIRKRCLSKNCKDYKSYGEQGVTICNEWKHNFPKFLNFCVESLGWNPSTHSRLHCDKDIRCAELGISPAIYSAKTIQFVSASDNLGVRYNIKDSTFSLKELAAVYNMDYELIRHRYKKGIIDIDQLTRPKYKHI